jgi:hypothetical protein
VERLDLGEHQREKDRVKGDAQGKDGSISAHACVAHISSQIVKVFKPDILPWAE